MDFKSKFNCGDVVIPIVNAKEQFWKPCAFCGGVGRIVGKPNKKEN